MAWFLMAINSGFILVDASEATSMADTARNALRSRSGDAGNSPQRLEALVKGLKQQAKEQQQASAKELAHSKTLGSTVKDVLKMVKVIGDNVNSQLAEQKKIAEETLKAAANKASSGRMPGQAARASGPGDSGAAYDVGSFKAAAKDIGGMNGPATAANDLIEDMRLGFNRVRDSAKALGVELYGNSILPEIQKHLQGIIDQLNTIKDDEDLLTKMAAAAGTGGSGPQVSSGALEKVIGDYLQNLKGLMKEDREAFYEQQRIQFNELQGGLISGIGVGGGGGGTGGGGGRGLEAITEAEFQDALFKAFRESTFLKIQGGIKTFGTLAVPAAVINIQQLNKEVNNLQGGMAGSVEAARDFRIETTNALQKIRAEGGFTLQEIGAASQAVMALGISSPEMVAKQSEIMLAGSRALGVEVGDVAQTYGMQARNLKLSSSQITGMIAGTLRIARETGLTAKNIMEIRKETQGFTEEIRRAGSLSGELANELARVQAVSSKLGLGTFQQDLQKTFMDASQLGNVSDDLALINAYVRNNLVKSGYQINEIISGTMLTTLEGQRAFARATKDSLMSLRAQAMAMGSEADAAMYLQNITRGRVKSLEEINRLIQLQTQASESSAEKAERLMAVEKQIESMRAAGLSDALLGNAIAELTGDTSLKTIEDLRSSIANAQGSIAADQENLAADFMNKLIKRQAQLMSSTNMSAFEARNKAFGEISGSMKGELSGMTFQEISTLAARGAQRASEEVAESAAAATDNMSDRITQGVQKGVQAIVGPFSDLLDIFDKAGIGPFVGAVAMFGTAAVLISSTLATLSAGLGKAGLLGAAKKATPALSGITGKVPGSGAENASKVQKAGNAAAGSTASVAKTASTVGNFVGMIGDLGNQIWKNMPGLIKGLAALTLVGVLIGGAVRLMAWAFPDASETLGVALAITASSVALGMLALASYLLLAVGLQIGFLTGPQAGVVLAAFLLGLGALTLAGLAIGGAMTLLTKTFPKAGEVAEVAKAVGASALAFGLLAASFMGLMYLGGAMLLLVSNPLTASLTVATIGLAVTTLAGTALALSKGMDLLHRAFNNPGKIEATAKALEASAGAFDTLASAYIKATTAGAVIASQSLAAEVLPVVALGRLIKFAEQIDNAMEKLQGKLRSSKQMQGTAESIKVSAGAMEALGQAYLAVVKSANLSLWKPLIDMAMNRKAMGSVLGFGEKLAPYMAKMNTAYGEVANMKDVADKVTKSAEVVRSLAGAATELKKYRDEMDGIVFDITAEDLEPTMQTLAEIARSIGSHIPDIVQSAPSKEDANKIKNAATAMSSLSEMMTATLNMQKKFGDRMFRSDPMDSMESFMADVASRMTNKEGGFHAIKNAIGDMPNFTDEEVDKLNTMTKAVQAVFDTIQVLGQINKEIPAKSMIRADLGDMQDTLEKATGVFNENAQSLTDLRNIFQMMPADIGERAVAFATMMGTIKTAILNVEALAKEFPSGGDRSMGVMNEHLRYIAANLDQEAIGSLANIFGAVGIDLPDRVDALSTGLERLPNLMAQIERFVSIVKRPALDKAHDDILYMAWALSPLGLLAESLMFDAPSADYFEQEVSNLIQTLGIAAQTIPEVLELRSEIEAKVDGRVTPSATTKTINDALTGPPGAGGTISNMSDLDASMAMETSKAASTISMGGAENRLDVLIREQQQTNQLMRQLVAALVAPPSRQQTSGAAPRRTFPRAGAIQQNVDAAWQSEEMLTTP